MTFAIPKGPRRIVCLVEEPTEILYALGEEARIVGISAYTVRPPEAKRDKPVVSAFVGGSIRKIKALEPDLVIGFSDVQADLARDLIKENLDVVIFNQRSIDEILEVIVSTGSLVQRADDARALVAGYIRGLEEAEARASKRAYRPKVYFEEWDEPMITGIRWVSELIGIAGGDDIFAELSRGEAAMERFVTEDQVAAAAPDLMFASWCGKPFDEVAVRAREAMGGIPALVNNQVYEIPAEIILQPGPACLTDGLNALERLVANVSPPS